MRLPPEAAAYVPPDRDLPDRERDDLNAMLASPGWRIFCEYVAGEWLADRVIERIETATFGTLAAAEKETTAAILASRKAVYLVMAWPQTRVHHLTTPIAPRTPARRPHRRARA